MIDSSLSFRRGYFLGKIEVPINEWWRILKLKNGLYLHTHEDLKVEEIICKGGRIFVLGEIFSTVSSDINLDELANCESREVVFECLKSWAGRFVVLCEFGDEYELFTDPVSLKNVYYSVRSDAPISVASDLSLFREFKFKKREDCKNFLKFISKELPKVGHGDCWIGNETIYADVFKLLPNKYLKLNDFSEGRSWPNSSFSTKGNTKDIAIQIADKIKTVLFSASNTNSLAIAVTAGYDSRVVAAASKTLDNEPYYFIDRLKNSSINEIDIDVASEVTVRLEKKLVVHDLPEENIPSEFEKLYYQNTYFATSRRLFTVNDYTVKLKNKLNVCGVGEVGRSRFGHYMPFMDSDFLAYKYGYINSPYAKKMSKEWFSESFPICKRYGIDPLTLFYWEQDLGNWGSVGNAESDIAIEEINPFNSYSIFELMLQVRKEDCRNDKNILFDEIIKYLEPSLAEVPINPVFGIKNRVKSILKKEPLFTFLDFVKFKYKTVFK
jgi:hypothetical protein